MNKDPAVFLQHILESINKIEAYTKRYSQKRFSRDTKAQDSVIRNLEIIGEATKNLPPSFTSQYPDVPWKKMAGLRDILIHFYFGVELDIVWDVIIKDLPPLKSQIVNLLKELASKVPEKDSSPKKKSC